MPHLKFIKHKGKDGVFIGVNSKTQVCSIRFTTEEYGWLVRYSEKNDISISAIIRKSLKTYRAALQAQQKKQGIKSKAEEEKE